jgi:hypothetical protein
MVNRLIEAYVLLKKLPKVNEPTDCIFCEYPHNDYYDILDGYDTFCCEYCYAYLKKLDTKNFLDKQIDGSKISAYLTAERGITGWSFKVDYPEIRYTYDDFSDGEHILYKDERSAFLQGLVYYFNSLIRDDV